MSVWLPDVTGGSVWLDFCSSLVSSTIPKPGFNTRSSLTGDLRVDTVLETKLAFKLVKTTGLCSTVHGKFLIVLDFLVTRTSTDTMANKGARNL